MIESVMIDIDDTLVDFGKSSAKAIELAFSELGLEFADHIPGVFVGVNNSLWKEIEKGTITKEQMYSLRWKTVFEKLGIDFDGMTMETRFRSIMSRTAVPVDHAFEILEYLYGKYPLYAASNSSYEHQKNRLNQADMLKYFNDIFVPDTVFAVKPSEEYYSACLSRMGVERPENAVMIGDSITADISGCVKTGITSIWYNPQRLPTPDSPRPTYTVFSLKEIEDIL